MKRVLILGAILFLAAPFTIVQSFGKSTGKSQFKAMPVWVGYQTVGSFNGATITGFVEYNPSTSTILFVYAEDQWGNYIEVVEYDGTIYSSGGVLYASGFRMNLAGPGGDYIVLNGALTMM